METEIVVLWLLKLMLEHVFYICDQVDLLITALATESMLKMVSNSKCWAGFNWKRTIVLIFIILSLLGWKGG